MSKWNNGPLSVTLPDAGAAAADLIPGVERGHVFGVNAAVGAGFEMIWRGGGIYTGFGAFTAQPLRVTAGGNAADDAVLAGLGAHEIYIEGLNADLEFESDTITTNGILAGPPSAKSFVRVNLAKVVTVGSFGTPGFNTGIVNIEQATSLVPMAVIAAVTGKAQNAMLSVARNKFARIYQLGFTSEGLKGITAQMCCRQGITRTGPTFGSINVEAFYTDIVDHTDRLLSPIEVPPDSDVWLDALYNGGGDTAVSGSFHYELRDV